MSPTPRTPTRKSTRDHKTQPTKPARRKLTGFESFAESTSAAIFITKGRGVLYANPAATRSTGYTREELLGMELWQIAHPNYQLALKQLGETQAWVEHIPSRYEIKIVTKGGEEHWLDITVGNIDYKGKHVAAVTAFDITERDRAERALRTAHAQLETHVQERTLELAAVNERLQSVLGTIAEAYVAFDSDWRFLQINPIAESKIFGRPASELIGKVIWDEYPQTVGQEVYVQYQLAVKTGRPVHFEMPSRIVPGHWFEVHAYPRGNGMEVYSRDITDRKQAEEEIASLARFPSENPNPVLRLNQTGDVLYANAASQTLLQVWADTTGDSALSYWRSLIAEVVASRADRTVDIVCNERVYSFFITPIAEAGYVNLYGQDITGRKQAEKALRQSEEKYRRLIENVNDLVCEVDAQAKYQFVNSQYEQVLGYAPEELLGRYARELIHPDDLRLSAPSFKNLVDAKSVSRNEWRFRHKNGEWRWFDCAAQTYEKSPDELRVVVISRDITERKQAEIERERLLEENSRQRRLLETIFDAVPDGIAVMVGREFAFQLTNPAYRALTPQPEVDPVGKCYEDVWNDPDAHHRLNNLQQVLNTGEPIDVEGQKRLYPNGRLRYFSFHARRLPWNAEYAALMVLHETTAAEEARLRADAAAQEAQRLAEELELRVHERTQELAQTNEELRVEIDERKLVENQLQLQMTAVRAAANGIVITDRQGNIQWCNPAFTHITDYSAEEVSGQNLRILSSGQHNVEFYQQLWATILAGEIWRGEITNRRKDGRLYIEEQTIAPVLNEQREITHFVAVKQDITERKQAEDRLERYNQDLLALSKAERDQRQLAETLTAANLALTQSLNLGTVLETLLEYVGWLVPYDSANVMLLEAESRLAVRVTRGYERWTNAELVRAITFDTQTAPLLNALLTTRRSCLVPDTRIEPGWQTPPGVEHVRSWLGVPLMAGGNVIGIYSLDKTEPGFFTTEHVRMAEMLAGQAAVAIQNAWLFEQVRSGRERLQSLSRRLVEVQEAERHYVARELHDEAGQALTSLLFRLGQLEQQTNEPRQADQVTELKQMTNGVLESLHRLAMDLRPASLDHLGLVPALSQYVKAIGDRYGLIAQFKAVGFEGKRLPAEAETALYRIVQEALTNIVRHARATRADVLLERRGDRVVVVVEDNGHGFDADVARFAQQGHLGLVGMQERAEMLGGSLVIESLTGAGTTIVVEVPYDNSHFDR